MKTLKHMYDNPSWNQPYKIQAKIKGYSDLFDIELVGMNQRPDCRIGHFGYNLFFRTRYGTQYKEYSSYSALVHAVKLAAKKHGLTVENIQYSINEKFI